MEFRRTTEQNEEDNCEHYNRQRVRAYAKEERLPVIAFDAVHEGISQTRGLEAADEEFGGLSKRLELAIGCPVILTHNLSVDHGLINGSQGVVNEIIFMDGNHPNHDDLMKRQLATIVIDFPSYVGPAYFSDDSESTWIPLRPKTCRADDDEAAFRTQFPLCLAYALTPWKAQGMTLERAIVKLTAACSKLECFLLPCRACAILISYYWKMNSQLCQSSSDKRLLLLL